MNEQIKDLVHSAIAECIDESAESVIKTQHCVIPVAFIDSFVALLGKKMDSIADKVKNIYSTDERDYYFNRGVDEVVSEFRALANGK